MARGKQNLKNGSITKQKQREFVFVLDYQFYKMIDGVRVMDVSTSCMQ
jgi:hypothetical protein